MLVPRHPGHRPPVKRGTRPKVLVIMGVSGVGKTTTGQRVAKKLGWVFRDADDFHPPANVAKMKSGTPLSDDDRWPWLEAIAHWIDERLQAGGRAVVTCSALKRSYRDRLLHGRPDVRLVFLKGSKALIADRISRRNGHFMPPALLDSQFAALEEPRRDERAIVVDVSQSPNRVVANILRYVEPQAVLPGEAPRPTRRDVKLHK